MWRRKHSQNFEVGPARTTRDGEANRGAGEAQTSQSTIATPSTRLFLPRSAFINEPSCRSRAWLPRKQGQVLVRVAHGAVYRAWDHAAPRLAGDDQAQVEGSRRSHGDKQEEHRAAAYPVHVSCLPRPEALGSMMEDPSQFVAGFFSLLKAKLRARSAKSPEGSRSALPRLHCLKSGSLQSQAERRRS